jgi:hypothetical protein
MELLRDMFNDFGRVFNDNTAAAYDSPITVLEAMWLAKWGNNWVTVEEIKDDDFWRSSFARLVTANLLESHRLVTAPDGNSGLTYRLV